MSVFVVLTVLSCSNDRAPADSGVQDAGRQTLDAGPQTLDAGRQTLDAQTLDAGRQTLDAGQQTIDNGLQDAGRQAQDAGPQAQDAGPQTQDAGPQAQDAGPQTQDAGPQAQDAGPLPGERCENAVSIEAGVLIEVQLEGYRNDYENYDCLSFDFPSNADRVYRFTLPPRTRLESYSGSFNGGGVGFFSVCDASPLRCHDTVNDTDSEKTIFIVTDQIPGLSTDGNFEIQVAELVGSETCLNALTLREGQSSVTFQQAQEYDSYRYMGGNCDGVASFLGWDAVRKIQVPARTAVRVTANSVGDVTLSISAGCSNILDSCLDIDNENGSTLALVEAYNDTAEPVDYFVVIQPHFGTYSRVNFNVILTPL